MKARREARARRQGTVGAPATHTATPSATGGIDVDPTEQIAVRNEITWGLVSAYSVDAERLMIKLNVSATRRMLISIRSDAPQFRTAVSMTMLAHHNGERLYVKYVDDLRRVPTADRLEVYNGVEVGLGEDALDIEDWPMKYTG